MANFYLLDKNNKVIGLYTGNIPSDAAKKAVTKHPEMEIYKIKNEDGKVFVYKGKKVMLKKGTPFTRKHGITHVPVVQRIGIEHK